MYIYIYIYIFIDCHENKHAYIKHAYICIFTYSYINV